MTASAWIGLIAVVLVIAAMPLGYWWLERDERPRDDSWLNPLEVKPAQVRRPYDSSHVDYRRF